MASETKRRRWLPAPFSRRATIVWAVIVAVLLVAGAYFMYDRLANGLGMRATKFRGLGLWWSSTSGSPVWRAACTSFRRWSTC